MHLAHNLGAMCVGESPAASMLDRTIGLFPVLLDIYAGEHVEPSSLPPFLPLLSVP